MKNTDVIILLYMLLGMAIEFRITMVGPCSNLGYLALAKFVLMPSHAMLDYSLFLFLPSIYFILSM